jgi:hypothetical protein
MDKRHNNILNLQPNVLYCLMCDSKEKQNKRSGIYKITYNNNKLFFKCLKCGTKYYISLKDPTKKIVIYK